MIEPCKCICHTTGYKTVKTSYPAQECCSCTVTNWHNPFIPEKFGTPDDSTCRESGIKLPNSESTLELKQQISEIREDIKYLFRWCNDLSELRHETNQNEGCTRAKVENDLMPAIKDLNERILTLENFIGQNYKVDRDQIDVLEKRIDSVYDTLVFHQQQINNAVERIEKLEKANEWQAERNCRDHERMKKLEGYIAGLVQNESPQQCNPVAETVNEKIGFTFIRALKEMRHGKNLRRKCWDKDAFIRIHHFKDYFCDQEHQQYFMAVSDVLACDWEIAE